MLLFTLVYTNSSTPNPLLKFGKIKMHDYTRHLKQHETSLSETVCHIFGDIRLRSIRSNYLPE